MNSGSGEALVVEPNLISLLDLVMQLLMFFIMCVTFVTDQAAAEISLPDSQAAAPIGALSTSSATRTGASKGLRTGRSPASALGRIRRLKGGTAGLNNDCSGYRGCCNGRRSAPYKPHHNRFRGGPET